MSGDQLNLDEAYLGMVEDAAARARGIPGADTLASIFVPALVAEVRRLRAEVSLLDPHAPIPEGAFDGMIGEPLARNADGTLNTDPVCVCNLPAEARLVLCPVHHRGEFLPSVES